MHYNYPEELPISSKRDEILQHLQRHQVVIVAGETGSGKTTQLPKICHQAFPNADGMIGCTQPRRIAASTVASRVAEEIRSSELVGYKIRFTDFTRPKTKIKFMTDGILLAEIRTDPQLRKYHTIIVDEAHERSLNIDFLLGYLKNLLPTRTDLHLVIASATIDTEAFAKHFDNAPVISVSGRTYPVETWYLPPQDDDESLLELCDRAVQHIFRENRPSDTLIFLPTERDIRECCEMLTASQPNTLILPMYGRMAAIDQQRIFKPSSQVKIIVATNVAETSITVPGIRYVIDSGLARISHYNVSAKTTSLPVEKISQASCHQRAGRCGRIGPGTCVRLFDEEDYHKRDAFTVPEIQRSNLADVILRMIYYKLGDPGNFPYIDKPRPRAIREGYKLLEELGAIDRHRNILPPGKFMATMPVDPCISRILLEARKLNCLREIKIISAALALQDPRIRPVEREKEADDCHLQFSHPHSDFMVLLNIWNHCFNSESSFSWSRLKKICKNNYLSFQRMREWYDLHEQLDRLLKKHVDFTDNSEAPSYVQLHKSLLSGLARNLATKKQGKIYQGANQKELMVFPGSHQFLKSGGWIVAASFLETSRLYALTVATIEPEWIEETVKHLCTYQWTNPSWHKKTGQVVATETASIFGLVILANRKVNFGKRHPRNQLEARQIFIQDGLVPGNLNGKYDFLQRNLDLIDSWRQTQAKLREKNILVDELAIASFYDRNLPAGVYDQRTLNRYLKKSSDQSYLVMQESDVLLRKPEEQKLYDFPASILHGQLEIPVSYHFEPGSEKDGITFHLPFDRIQTISPHRFSWLVPGLLPEKISFLLKSLPKSIRKKLVPLNETVDRILDDLGEPSTTPLLSGMEQSILKHFKILIKRSDWTENLPVHLTPRFAVLDNLGKEIQADRNLTLIIESLAANASSQITDSQTAVIDSKVQDKWQNSVYETWDFNGLPETIPLHSAHGTVVGFLYTALVAEGNGVRIAFMADRQSALQSCLQGNLHLLALHFHNHLKALKKQLKTSLSGPSVKWLSAEFGNTPALQKTIIFYLLQSVFGTIPPGVINKAVFAEKIQTAERDGFYQKAIEHLHDLLKVIRLRREVEDTVFKLFGRTASLKNTGIEKRQQLLVRLEEIFPARVLSQSPAPNIADLQRYLRGLLLRTERCYVSQSKDDVKLQLLLPFAGKLADLKKRQSETLSMEAVLEIERFLTLYEEYHISVFAPEVGTKETISAKILEKQWQAAISRC